MRQTTHTPRVLIVDDDPDMAAALLENLGDLGQEYALEQVNSGEEALARLRQAEYSLILTDYKMPNMDGLDLARAVRRISPDTQVVLMTAYGTEGLQTTVEAMELGGYLNKPFSLAEIRSIVRKAIDRCAAATHARSDGTPLRESLSKHLVSLQSETGAYCVLLLSSSGMPLESIGFARELDVSGVCALVAANFAASEELARILGSSEVFKSSYYEGPEYSIYAHDVNGDLLLAVIFGAKTKPGAVWFYAKDAAAGMAKIIADRSETIPVQDPRPAAIDAGFDKLWRRKGEQSNDRKLMSFDEAASAGLVSGELNTRPHSKSEGQGREIERK